MKTRKITGVYVTGYDPATCRFKCIVQEEITSTVQEVIQVFGGWIPYVGFATRIETVKNEFNLTKPQLDNILYEIQNEVF